MRGALVQCGMFAALLAVAGCVTPYQKNDFGGGYSETRIDANTFIVHFTGTGNTSRDTTRQYAMVRAAQLTLAAKCDYFIIASAEEQSNSSVFGRMAQGVTLNTGIFNAATSTTSIIIKTFKGQKPDQPNAFDARELIQYANIPELQTPLATAEAKKP